MKFTPRSTAILIGSLALLTTQVAGWIDGYTTRRPPSAKMGRQPRSIFPSNKINLPDTFWIMLGDVADNAIHDQYTTDNFGINLASLFRAAAKDDHYDDNLGMKAVKVDGEENLWMASQDQTWNRHGHGTRNSPVWIYIRPEEDHLLVKFVDWNVGTADLMQESAETIAPEFHDVWKNASRLGDKAGRHESDWIVMHGYGCTPEGQGKWESDADCYIQWIEPSGKIHQNNSPICDSDTLGQIFEFRLELENPATHVIYDPRVPTGTCN